MHPFFRAFKKLAPAPTSGDHGGDAVASISAASAAPTPTSDVASSTSANISSDPAACITPTVASITPASTTSTLPPPFQGVVTVNPKLLLIMNMNSA